MQSTLVINKCGKALFFNDATYTDGMPVENFKYWLLIIAV
jgi:hypothetical protein